jgi:2-desacetyl-2-hydroxyethyl bacteriochlorophyllide A dehydrogenase
MSIGARTVMFTSPRQLAVRDSSLPPPADDQVLVRTLYSGISAGTEMNVFRGLAPQWHALRDPASGLFVKADSPEWSYPLAYGYAAVGRVEKIGVSVPSSAALSEGDLVFSYTPHSSVSIVRWDRLVPLPALDDPRLGVFVANLNTATNGILDARPSLGDVVVVSGLGVIGLIVVQLLRRSGVGSIVAADLLEPRRLMAKRLGADVVLDPADNNIAEQVRALTDNRGADIVIEVSGAGPALNEAIRTVGYNGRVVILSWYGSEINSLSLAGEFHHNRPRIISSQVGGINPDLGPLWSPQRRQAFATSLLPELELGPLVTHEFPVDEALAAYTLIDQRDQNVIQCVLSYTGAH